MGHRLAPEAVADLDEIWYYAAKESGSFAVADRLIDSATSRFALLAGQPQLGRAREALRPGLRSFPVGSYLILYRVESGNVLISRVLHGRRDLDAILGQ